MTVRFDHLDRQAKGVVRSAYVAVIVAVWRCWRLTSGAAYRCGQAINWQICDVILPTKCLLLFFAIVRRFASKQPAV